MKNVTVEAAALIEARAEIETLRNRTVALRHALEQSTAQRAELERQIKALSAAQAEPNVAEEG